MINLTNTTDKLQLARDSTADVDVVANYVDRENDGDPITPGRELHTFNTAATGDIVAAPGSSTCRAVVLMSVRNRHASTAVTVTVIYNANGTTYELHKCVLNAGEVLLYSEALGFYIPNTSQAAAQADQEAAASATLYVSPAFQQYHPSACKCWGKITNSGGTPTLQVSYNTTSISDTATDQVTVTIATDFSSANYSCNVSIEAQTTSLSATTTSLAVFIRNATQAAGSFIIQACEFDIGGATDPSAWHYCCFGDL